MEQLRTGIESTFALFGINAATTVLGNTLTEYALSLVLLLVGYTVFRLLQQYLLVRLAKIAERTPTTVDNTLVKMVQSFRPPFYVLVAFWFALQFLEVHSVMEKVVTAVVIVWAVYQVVIAVGILIEDLLIEGMARDKDPTTRSALLVASRLAKGAIWGIGVIILLSNLGVDVTGLLAGVGIGGIAVAFALQGILSDLFSSFSIYFDKPFEVGDFIIVGDKMGTVEQIGIKSTRVRALSGEELVFSNHFLTGAQIQNFKKMRERRIVFKLGVTYGTPREKLERGLECIREAVGNRENARLDRVHFAAFGDYALQYECVYFVTVPDYNAYMDTQQAINFDIMDSFSAEGLEMAFPTQTIALDRETRAQLSGLFAQRTLGE